MLASFRSATVALATLYLVPVASAQSPKEIFERMYSAYAERASSIHDYTLVQQMMGVETVMYFEKATVDGRVAFKLKQTRAAGYDIPIGEHEGSWDEIYSLSARLGDNATYVERSDLDDHAVHVIRVTDLADLDLGDMGSGSDDFTPSRGHFFIDTEMLVVRRMVLEGELVMDGERRDVTMTVDLRDYRETDRMLHPFSITMLVEGMGGMNINDEEMAQMKQQYEEMMKQLDEMPEQQQKMVESMMKGQMERMQEMMKSGEEGGMSVEVTVSEIRVNAGPPQGG